MNENDFEKIDSMIAHHVGTFADSIQHKLDIVVEGHQMLSEKIDRVETRLDKRMDCLEHKLVAVAADLSAHRRDTEAHPPPSLSTTAPLPITPVNTSGIPRET